MFFGDAECRVRYLEIWWAGTKKIVDNQKTFDDSFFHLMFFLLGIHLLWQIFFLYAMYTLS